MKGFVLSVMLCCLLPLSGWAAIPDQGYVSYYADHLSGRRTASGEPYDPLAYTAAHRSLPFGTRVMLREPRSGKEIEVVINDRGPFVRGRVMDISRAAAEALGITRRGVAHLQLSLHD